MEEEPKEQEKRRSASATGEQYLLALLMCADWIAEPYKQLADESRTNTDILKELYLCACDGVPVEKAAEALEQKPADAALHLLHRKHIEQEVLDRYSEDLSGIKKTTSTLEQEVMRMSETLTHIAAHVPSFDSMFPEQSQIQKEWPPEQSKEEAPETLQKDNADPDVEMRSEMAEEQKRPDKTRNRKALFETSIRKLRSWKRPKQGRGDGVQEFVEQCLKDGYDNDQINFFLDCIEEGLPSETVKRFASPKLPVSLMQRLKALEKEKERKNGE